MIPRSWLYVPGHRADRIEKALASAADAVVIDLEDAVPADRKQQARSNTVAALNTYPQRAIWVRINAATAEAQADLDILAAAENPPAGLRVPKVESPAQLQRAAELGPWRVHALIESAAGLLRLEAIAQAHTQVDGIALGEADLAADLRVARDGLEWARGWLVCVARAYGLDSPVASVFTDVADIEGLRTSCQTARQNGFHGRSAIHPSQLKTINDVFTPTRAELDAAQRVVEAARSAARRGEATVLDHNGSFIDPAVVAGAEAVLARAEDAPTIPPTTRSTP
ncbi:CoA ester lyase [Mycolicibacterium chubuense]|uniref:(3S)-malyl-CoA thioesterase n=1 Tax=Mycolicibacterium chubuense TaxID=1800 RepID=A0A0J6WA55_MYCCU|nr:CoA ester lyase [Mycolicibacterium chubuense]KMO78798.1 (3S)-malyl-CoA thioesterase [Mycolicibacterium chubuense]ORA53489.1 CoA ester lyase [Mycolicibacterium chubuense]SPX96308.1 Citrate lyase subunit beta [Mycolicibacterium chubuense]